MLPGAVACASRPRTPVATGGDPSRGTTHQSYDAVDGTAASVAETINRVPSGDQTGNRLFVNPVISRGVPRVTLRIALLPVPPARPCARRKASPV